MNVRLRPMVTATIAALLLIIAAVPSDAARRGARRWPYDGTWSVVISTLRGDCASVRASLRIVHSRVRSEDESYQAMVLSARRARSA